MIICLSISDRGDSEKGKRLSETRERSGLESGSGALLARNIIRGGRNGATAKEQFSWMGLQNTYGLDKDT